jgi:hypothetical protein
MSGNDDFWILARTLAESIRAQGGDRTTRQAALTRQFEAMPPQVRQILAHDFRFLLAELRGYEPSFLTLVLELGDQTAETAKTPQS